MSYLKQLRHFEVAWRGPYALRQIKRLRKPLSVLIRRNSDSQATISSGLEACALRFRKCPRLALKKVKCSQECNIRIDMMDA